MDCGLQHLLLSSDDRMNWGKINVFFFFFFKWIEDSTRFVTVIVPRLPGELQFVNRVASELFIDRTIVKPKKIPPLEVASSLQHLLFVHGNQRTWKSVQAVTQKIMGLDLPQRRKVGPVIR